MSCLYGHSLIFFLYCLSYYYYFFLTIEDQESSLKELHRLSDELEFKETEVMNAKDTLRSTRAKLAIQQGKLTHARMYVPKLIFYKSLCTR